MQELQPQGTEEEVEEEVEEVEEEVEEEQGGTTRRMKIMQTMLIYFGGFDLGVSALLLGPTLLDLEYLVSSDTASMSIVVICRSLGSILGNLISGFLIGRINPWLMFLLTKFSGGVFTIAAVWCRSIFTLAFCFIPWGFAIGFFDALANTMILLIWGTENGPWMQAFHCLFSVGCLVAPLIAQPFLMEAPDVSFANISTTELPPAESQIIYAYLISGIIMFISGTSFTWMFFLGDKRIFLVKAKDSQKAKESKDGGDPLKMVNKCLYGLFLSFLAVMYCLYCAAEGSFGTYLLTYAVKYMNWTKKSASNLTAALMGAFTAGRALGIPLVMLLHPSIILTADLVLMVAFLAVLSAFVEMHDAVMWVCTVGFGFAMASFYGTGFTWTERRIGTRARVSALILVASAVGEMSGPAMVGPLMGKVGYSSFAYINLTFVAVSLFSLIALEVLSIRVNLGKTKMNGVQVEVTECLAEDVS